jgi:hypothetical protein
MKFYVVEDGQLVEKTGYCVLGKFHAVKLGKGNWVVYDSKSGVKLVDGLKTIMACAAWVKSEAGMAAVTGLRSSTDYVSLTTAMRDYRHAHKAVKAEAVAEEPTASTSTEGAVEVDSTPVTK